MSHARGHACILCVGREARGGDCAARGVERAVVVCHSVCLCANAHPFFLQVETSCEDQHCSKRDIVYDTDDASICRIMDKEALAIKDF